MEDNILSNIHEKIESGFYLDKINIDGKSDVGIAVRLPLPLRFDEEWFKYYKEQNITRGSVICYHIDGYLKKV